MQSERIEQILLELGYNLQDRGKYWQTSANYRDGDNKTAIQIWKDTGIWKDFVANTKYMPFKKLVQLSSGNDEEKTIQILKDFQNHEPFDFEKKPREKMEIDQFFDHDEIKTLLPHYSFYNKKKISDKILSLYKSGFSMSGKMNGRYVFPIYDSNNKVIGISGRHLLWKDSSSFPKWKHIGKKSNWIYPVYIGGSESLFSKQIEATKEIILVEGIGDSLALSEQDIYNHMVIFGLEISSKQIAYLLSQSLNKIIISTNKDEKSERGQNAAIKIFLKLTEFFDISKLQIKLPLKKDFAEMLESDINIESWLSKEINQKKQIEFILKAIDNNESLNQAKHKKLLTNFLEQLHAERNAISE